ncbi:apolipoprotein N-acyltransferase [Nocardioides psychrotolerans]|uniref:Apolipoprotein N-acyltransferase n=1 Tax=Nocardioides psychrotolerans TaxID=1005945 RepID=A0A1I3K429_9ACTN|nr:apolipoprotein N-acyltransferase [Nocardioides psychrotolerans]GEP38415.1 apolipoprotein N-acyltransferase [Nocardioides psychrotolerans]SFI67261.1 apolipoprotein N-acyltransferase [Nocardioides psychrotolerans]
MLLRTSLALVAGLTLSLAFEPLALPIVMPFAVAAFFLSTRGLRARSAWIPGLGFGVAFYFTHISWMRDSIGPDAWVALATIESLFYAVLGSVTAALHRRRLWALWMAPAWVTMEVVRSGWPFSGMPWGRLAFGVVDTPAAPALPYVGSVGVSLLVALVSSLLAWVVVARGREQRVAGGASVAVLALTLLPALTPYDVEETGQATVAAVQGNLPGPADNILFDSQQVTDNHVQATIDLADQIAAGAQPEVDFVLWPENSTASDPFGNAAVNAGIRSASAAIGVPILVGAIVDAGPDHVLNQGIVWDPVTGAGERYTKRHPVPYGEYIPLRDYLDGTFGKLALIPRDMLSGSRKTPLEIAGISVADAICFDIAYDDGLYDQVSRGAELLTVQTSNASFIFTDQIDQQFAMTRLRAIEAGRWLVVASPNGISGVISPEGEVVATADPRTQAVLVEQVGLSSDITLAVRLGPWVGRSSAVLTGVGLLLGLLAYRRSRHSPAPGGVLDENPEDEVLP